MPWQGSFGKCQTSGANMARPPVSSGKPPYSTNVGIHLGSHPPRRPCLSAVHCRMPSSLCCSSQCRAPAHHHTATSPPAASGPGVWRLQACVCVCGGGVLAPRMSDAGQQRDDNTAAHPITVRCAVVMPGCVLFRSSGLAGCAAEQC